MLCFPYLHLSGQHLSRPKYASLFSAKSVFYQPSLAPSLVTGLFARMEWVNFGLIQGFVKSQLGLLALKPELAHVSRTAIPAAFSNRSLAWIPIQEWLIKKAASHDLLSSPASTFLPVRAGPRQLNAKPPQGIMLLTQRCSGERGATQTQGFTDFLLK